MDIIYIRALTVDTIVGVYDWERKIRQNVVFDLDIACDIQPAAQTDNLQETLNYKAICDRVTAFVRNSRYQLIETLVEKTAQMILAEFSAPWLRLCVDKRGALGHAQHVGIRIERGVRPALD